MLENLGRYDGAHGDYCKTHLCCRCQQRAWTTRLGDERLCGLCASCCRECGRAPARHLEGLNNGLCAECRGRCARCGNRNPEQGTCPCRTWRKGPGNDPIAFIMQGFPQPLLQALGHRFPRSLPDILFGELDHRTPAQLLARVERRWHTRWSHAIHERDEDDRRRWSPQEIAEFLVGRGPCRNPACEDGYLIHDDTPCGHCRQPEHRFVPGTAETTSTGEHARRTAAEIRRALLAARTDRKRKPDVHTGTGMGTGTWPHPSQRDR
ncbi:hypothetical protein GCM10010497_41840 [Streptomyces cinereoruber]|uniref:TNFR-Cys domain-containing protein n=1 Tax=Streptomyces cinereoruber TaxID=67260 RepID=A0AAV4KNF5_9ACTN|nr:MULTISPECIES: hypothetical protein [Streptomyces]MBB4156598.1 hypothetical protein [Streptomyces cinereoruber]NIH61329.1 hypothetical protein [Streptomyces cinereoruber]GGR34846.1 hypothetical protein GCM10010497_41840 [Streptomyces cinereoruber]